VKRRLGRGLASGSARLAIIAKDLRVSPRTLQRRLAEQVRLQACSELRAIKGMKKSAISDELGFSNPSAFHRWSHRQAAAAVAKRR
jgi:AraC-like DNA-binding protein